MPDLRELEKITPEEAKAVIKRRKALELRGKGNNGRLPTDKVKVGDWEAEALCAWPVLDIWEILWLYRKRSGKHQREVAAELGITRYWVNRMEQGEANPDRLIEYWEV